MSFGNIKCPRHGEHGNVRDSGKTCGLCYAEGIVPTVRPTKIHVPRIKEDVAPRKKKIA